MSFFRPPDRRRREVFGVANNTLFPDGAQGNASLSPADNSTDGVPPLIEYPFSEDKVSAEYLEIPSLQPFTVYRIDIHACNEEVGLCSAGAFVFARTKPACEWIYTRRGGAQHRPGLWGSTDNNRCVITFVPQ